MSEAAASDPELGGDRRDVKDESVPFGKRRIDEAELSLDESIAALNRIKAKLADCGPFDDSLRRDLVFESDMRKVSRRVIEFNRYIETVKEIKSLCVDNYPSPSPSADGRLPPAIAQLLKSAESALLFRDRVL